MHSSPQFTGSTLPGELTQLGTIIFMGTFLLGLLLLGETATIAQGAIMQGRLPGVSYPG